MASRPTDRNLHIDRDRSGMAAVVIHQLRLAGFEGQYLQAANHLLAGLIHLEPALSIEMAPLRPARPAADAD